MPEDINIIENNTQEYHNCAFYGYENNKDIPIASIDKIEIEKFRSLSGRELKLGKHLTIISGKNGTMKTTLMGLIAHPFSNNTKDAFGAPLKTKLSDVFKLSKKYDDEYSYNVCFTSTKNEKIKETVKIDVVGDRHRIVVSGHGKGDGNFIFNTSFHNLGRLNPIVETSANEKEYITLTNEEQQELIKFYAYVFVSTNHGEFLAVSDDKKKKTFGPTGEKATYDFNSISSGEDNIGSIFNKLVAFERAGNNGILCIDEIEASLHPSAQVNMINYLYKWAKDNGVQVILTTHSLHIIQTLYLKNKCDLDNGNIVIDFISFSQTTGDKNYKIISNPEYSLAYKELTLSSPEEISQRHKATIYCEDEMAKHLIRSLLGRNLLKYVKIEHNLNNDQTNTGTDKNQLKSLCKNFPSILEKTNSFVVFDGDTTKEEVKKIKNHTLYAILPDKELYAIERRILLYLLTLPPKHEIFTKINKMQEAIKNELIHDCRIIPAEIETIKCVDISNCKIWANNNKSIFKQCITQYCKDLDIKLKEQFKRDFLICLNEVNTRLGLPKLNDL